MDFIVIGDVHATKDSIEECENLIDFIIENAQNKDCRNILFLGDLFDNFSLINTYVLTFWDKVFTKAIDLGLKVYVIKGNHDCAGAGLDEGPHALSSFADKNANLIILDKPTIIAEGILAVPHYYDQNSFLTSLQHNLKTVYCHQTLDGSKYDNGFYAKDAADVSPYTATYFIAGHIHAKQEWANVLYTGAPRWFNLSDANKQKGIWYVKHDETGKLVSKEFLSTENVCRPIYLFDIFEDIPFDYQKLNLNNNNKTIVNIHGQRTFITEISNKLNILKEKNKLNLFLRPFLNNEKIIKIKESEGLEKAFKSFYNDFETPNGSKKEELLKVIKERVPKLFT
jgi:DNA repair exonuclease SbcCD nuclease subunit